MDIFLLALLLAMAVMLLVTGVLAVSEIIETIKERKESGISVIPGRYKEV